VKRQETAPPEQRRQTCCTKAETGPESIDGAAWLDEVAYVWLLDEQSMRKVNGCLHPSLLPLYSFVARQSSSKTRELILSHPEFADQGNAAQPRQIFFDKRMK
jgi:hypothetical protein